MNIIVIFGLLMVVGLIIVSLIHEKQKKEQMRRLQQRRLRVQVEELNEVLTCVEQTVGDKSLAKKINDLIYGLLHAMRNLENKPAPYIDNALQKVVAHNLELENSQLQFRIRYERESDAQINKTQQQLVETINILSNLTSQGRLTETEFESFQNQLRWAHLMVAVMSFVAQGNKCLAISDRVTAQAFYQRALHQLMESPHPNPKRLGLIREINEMLEGNRVRLSENLITADAGFIADLDTI
jgi:hypothetical protein